MMTLDEAIKHAEDVAEQNYNNAVYILDKTKSDIAMSKALECKKCAEEHQQLAEWLKELKQLREQTRWIPVSERLPNLDDFTGSEAWQKKVLITGYLSFDDTKDLFVSEAFAKDVIYNSVHDTIITAWMPLPEPYKAERRNKK